MELANSQKQKIESKVTLYFLGKDVNVITEDPEDRSNLESNQDNPSNGGSITGNVKLR